MYERLPWLILLNFEMRDLTILADFLFNRIVKNYGKPTGLRPYHRTRHAGLFVKSQHREPEADPLSIFNCSSGDNVDTACAHVPDQIPICS